MIYVEMYGRLGNQFFRYAVARSLQLRYYPNENLCFNFQQVTDAGKRDLSFYNVLRDYNVVPYQIYSKGGKVIFKESNLKQKAICIPYYLGMRRIKPEDMNEQVAYERKWSQVLNKNGIYWFRRGGWNLSFSDKKNKFVSGNFEDPAYFNEIREILLKEFQSRHSLLSKNIDLFNKICETDSVCLSVRRGDFESNNNLKKLHSVCHKDYFEKSIYEIRQRIKKPVFFMFSDDIEWVKNNISTESETYYEDGTDPVWEKLRLMSSCKHFIISNSTFSWWAQWLSQNENKIVISPSRWFNNEYKSPLIQSNFITIKV